jgi:hypothetical protein
MTLKLDQPSLLVFNLLTITNSIFCLHSLSVHFIYIHAMLGGQGITRVLRNIILKVTIRSTVNGIGLINTATDHQYVMKIVNP